MTIAPEKLAAVFGKPLNPAFAEKLAAVFASPLTDGADDRLIFSGGQDIPVVNHVPRFVPSDAYVKSFSFQWTQYQRIKHDSLYTSDFSKSDLMISEERRVGKGCGSTCRSRRWPYH